MKEASGKLSGPEAEPKESSQPDCFSVHETDIKVKYNLITYKTMYEDFEGFADSSDTFQVQ